MSGRRLWDNNKYGTPLHSTLLCIECECEWSEVQRQRSAENMDSRDNNVIFIFFIFPFRSMERFVCGISTNKMIMRGVTQLYGASFY